MEDNLSLLVEHFGMEKVRRAFSKIERQQGSIDDSPSPDADREGATATSVSARLDELEGEDPDKHALLVDFYAKLKGGEVLVVVDDIRQFASIVGIKRIEGASRKSMIADLVLSLSRFSNEKIERAISSAGDISEDKRREGYSVLADKLLDGMGKKRD